LRRALATTVLFVGGNDRSHFRRMPANCPPREVGPTIAMRPYWPVDQEGQVAVSQRSRYCLAGCIARGGSMLSQGRPPICRLPAGIVLIDCMCRPSPAQSLRLALQRSTEDRSSSGATRTSMLRAAPGLRRINPARSRVSTTWWTEGGVTPKCR